jgi:hypothetical protein
VGAFPSRFACCARFKVVCSGMSTPSIELVIQWFPMHGDCQASSPTDSRRLAVGCRP